MTEQNWQWMERKIGEAMNKGIDLAVGQDLSGIMEFVERQKTLHPEFKDNPAELARRIIGKKQWYAGAVSFAYGLGGLLTILPNLVHIWRIHGRLVLTVAYIFGYDMNNPERREEIALCFALSSGNQKLKKLLQEAGILDSRKFITI